MENTVCNKKTHLAVFETCVFHVPQWVGLSISRDLSNFMAYGVKILAHSGQMHNLGTLCILVNSFDTLGYISYNDLRSHEFNCD